MRKPTTILGCAAAAVVLAVSACSAPPTGSGTSTPPGGTATSAGPHDYTSKNFSVPLTVRVDPVLGAAPELDTPGILAWTSRDNRNNRIRFLAPVEVYPPGSSAPVPPPEDFVGYIRGLASHGGVYTDQSSLRVDGVEAIIMTATTPAPMDGALGCPAPGAERVEDCFGLQPDYTLRLAAMQVNGKPLLVWARFDNAFPDQAFLSSFDEMLKTVDFGGVPATPGPGYYGYGITSGR